MKTYLLTLFLLSVGSAYGQVTFFVQHVPAATPAHAALYVAGDFNGWNPGDPAYRLTEDSSGTYRITLKARPEGTPIQFKFTRGSWETVEKGSAGEELQNRQFVYGNKDTLYFKVLNWADLISDGGGGSSTADTNVHLLSKAFFIPQLNRYRRIWIYLPPDYYSGSDAYPVLYMHDGQNLFDDKTAFAGEWQVDETLNRFYLDGKKIPIVIGIDNGGSRRIDELTPWVNPQYGGGEGKLYTRFIVETLKPYVDSAFRTLLDRKHTAIMGSSLGGLLSFYAALNYQDVFGMAGIFSPSFWFSDSVWRFVRMHPAKQQVRLYLLCGGNESAEMVPDMMTMKDSLEAVGFLNKNIFSKVVPGGQHNEKLWQEAFGNAWLWLSGQKEVTGLMLSSKDFPFLVYPNPVDQNLYLAFSGKAGNVEVEIFDVHGIAVMRKKKVRAGKINVARLKAGFYLLKVTREDSSYFWPVLKK